MEQSDKVKDRDTAVRFVTLKVGKLTNAIYILTGFLIDQEPLKWQLRTQALTVFNLLQKSLITASSIKNLDLDKFNLVINEMASLMDLTVSSQLVSEMNFGILKREYLKLIDVLMATGRNLAGVVTESAMINVKDVKDKGQISNSIDPIKDITLEAVNPTTKPYKADNRSELILSFLRGKGLSSVRDIGRVIPELSSKTIQRELNALLQARIIKKEGERRWSRYNIV